MAQKKLPAGTKKLVLLDSHAILHRAYHSIPPDFATSKGEPTNALYGLVAMMLKIIDDVKPDYVIACRDLPGKTHRHDKFEAYKATRLKADDALISQLKKAPEVFEAFGIPVYGVAGFEADDCLGTIVHDLKDRSDIHTTIASGDMDTLQLVSPRVSVYTLRKGLNDTITYDEDRVKERYGFGPEQVVDYKALRGDPSDNIPGIKGIGEKTATDLIVEFGSLEELYKQLEKNENTLLKKGVKARMVGLLKNGKKDAFFSKDLATIHTGAPINFKIPAHEWSFKEHIATIEKLCDELEFRALKARVHTKIQKKDEEDGVPSETLFAEAEAQVVDATELRETEIALWLLRSDYTNPNLDNILAYGNSEDFGKAKEKIYTDLKSTGRLQEVYDTIEKPLIPIVRKMDAVGVALDVGYLKKLAKEYNTKLDAIVSRITKAAGHEFNINSPKQLAVVLYDELNLVPAKQKKTAGGARTTREDELLKMREMHPIIDDILAHRELQKLLSTYIEKMPLLVGEDGRLHATFLQAGAVTGRMASQNPGLQNIPIKTEYGARIRNAFVAEKGNVLIAIDYSQIELRIAAGLSGDEKLVSAFKNGEDIHTAVASQVFGVAPEKVDKEMRRKAKVINFGILYGMGVNALRENLGGVTREESAKYLADYFEKFSGLAAYIEKVKRDATKTGFTETLFGRRRYFPDLKSSLPMMRSMAERMAVNAPIQGTSADIIKLAMVQADALIEKKKWGEDARLVLQVHDELVYEVNEKKSEEIAKEILKVMENVVPKNSLAGVPILAETKIGRDWGDMEKI